MPDEFDLDAMNVLIASGLCLVVSVMFGLLPAVRFSNPNLITAMKDDAGGGGTNTIRVHRLAAMVQIGIAVPFLVISGVMLDRVRTADFGFPLEGIAGARVPATEAGKPRDAGAIRAVRDNLKQAIGVQSVAVAEGMPIDFDYREFRVGSADQTQFATAHVARVAEHFVETAGAKLLRGRTIDAEDGLMSAPVVVVSNALATQLFPGAEALGRKVKFTLDDSREQEAEIVGVTNDFATSQLTTTRLQMLLPLPETLTPTAYLIVRSAPGGEPQLKSALESALRELGVEALPGVAFPGIVTGQEMTEKSIGDLIAESVAVGVVGGLVLVLATLGVVGVIGFMVATRTKEFAIRMALGSSRLAVFRMTLFGIIKLVVPGVFGGLTLAAVLIRTMKDVLGTPLTLGPDPLGVREPLIYAGASAIAIVASMLAGIPAARRATRVAPMVAIKAE
ncbi:MAG: ABC transporter permease [Cyanobacteria bacterium]|nr:ABC transporter permease [Cyanobacteriota bacterium]